VTVPKEKTIRACNGRKMERLFGELEEEDSAHFVERCGGFESRCLGTGISVPSPEITSSNFE
jgi:hypothetical protein